MRRFMILLLAGFGLSVAANAQSTPPPASSPQFITIGDNAILSSGLIGLDVKSASGESRGKIQDIVFEDGQITGVVLSVGAVLGAGERYVAVDPSAISVRYAEDEHTWHATMNAGLDELRSAPEFKYEGKWKR